MAPANTATDATLQALAESYTLLQTDHEIVTFPAELIDPLIQSLQTEDPQLSYWITRLLTHSPPQPLTGLLGQVANDQTRPTPDRLTAIAALQLRTGKKAVTILVALLDDPDGSICQMAFQSLSNLLALDPSVTMEQIQEQIWPNLKKLSQAAFLQRQLVISADRILAAKQLQSEQTDQLEQLKQRYLESQTQWLNQITDPDAKLQILQGYLENPEEPFLRIWVLEQINEWCSSSTISSPEQGQNLVDLLVNFISDSNGQIRQLTANALEKLVENAQSAALALTEQLTVETNPQAQIAQLEALSILAYIPATAQAIRLLQADVPDVAAQAARMLGNIAVVESKLNNKKRFDEISQALIQRYSKANGSAIVRREIINAIWKLASLQSYQPDARTLFLEILRDALTNADGNCRSFAVRALTELFKQEVFPFILSETAYLLDDEDSSVRFRVLEAFQKYGNTDQLIQLRERLEKEEETDLIKSLRTTFADILQKQSTDQVYHWAQQLQESQESRHPKELRLLADQVIDLLWKKIVEDKTQNRPVPVDFELLALTQLALKTEQSSQPELALNWYQKIIDLDVSEEIKKPYHLKIAELLPPEPAATAPTETPASSGADPDKDQVEPKN